MPRLDWKIKKNPKKLDERRSWIYLESEKKVVALEHLIMCVSKVCVHKKRGKVICDNMTHIYDKVELLYFLEALITFYRWYMCVHITWKFRN